MSQLTSSLTDGTAQAIQSVVPPADQPDLVADGRHGAGDPVGRRPPDQSHHLACVRYAQALAAVDHRITNVTETIDGRSAHLTDTIAARFLDIHQGLETRVGAVASDIDTRVAQFEDLLGSRIEAVAGRIESSGRQASEDLMAARRNAVRPVSGPTSRTRSVR